MQCNRELGIYHFQPLLDPRWREFVQRHRGSTVFHTAEWLTALCRTYGYEPIAFTTSPATTTLKNAAVFCRVRSWLTGHRLVSLPFSDHADLLIDDLRERELILSALEKLLNEENLQHVEFRPTRECETTNLKSFSTYTYCLHQLDLRPSLETLFDNLHKDSIQRKIRRAEREGLAYEEGSSARLFNSFYQLLFATRLRHSVLPHPMRWFHALIDCFQDGLTIRVALKNGLPIASILTLRCKDTLVYKYGCSDAQYHRLGGMQMLLWRSIQEAKRGGLSIFDFGRSDWDNEGLIRFKDRWDARRSTLTYVRIFGTNKRKEPFTPAGAAWKGRTTRTLLRHLPESAIRAAGELISKHLG